MASLLLWRSKPPSPALQTDQRLIAPFELATGHPIPGEAGGDRSNGPGDRSKPGPTAGTKPC